MKFLQLLISIQCFVSCSFRLVDRCVFNTAIFCTIRVRIYGALILFHNNVYLSNHSHLIHSCFHFQYSHFYHNYFMHLLSNLNTNETKSYVYSHSSLKEACLA